jgi:hypothetical protein
MHMNPNSKRTAMSARRKLSLTLVGVLAALAASGVAVFAAGGKADFAIAASPSSQTVTQGQSTSYSVTVDRVNGFAGSVTLSVGSLPSGATASWKLSNGTSSNVVPPSLNSATLTIQTASTTPTATSQPVVTATSDKLSHTTTLTLAVQAAAQPNFTLAASPSSQTVVQGDQTSFSVNVNRTGGFSGAVSLSVSGLPKGATASWASSSTVSGPSSGATLVIDAAENTKEDTSALTVTGSGTINGSSVSRSAAVTLIVQKKQNFQIAGNLGTQLVPGRKVPLDLTLTNPYNFALQVTSTSVAIEEGTSRAGCSGTNNFKVTQIPASRFPITLPAGQPKTLGQLGVADAAKPQVEMLDRPWSQDACKNAALTLDYSGSASK